METWVGKGTRDTFKTFRHLSKVKKQKQKEIMENKAGVSNLMTSACIRITWKLKTLPRFQQDWSGAMLFILLTMPRVKLMLLIQGTLVTQC